VDVTIQKMFVMVDSVAGPYEKQHGHSRVLVNGSLVGYVPIEGEPSPGVFHPLPNCPRELDQAIVDAAGGKLTGSIRNKKVSFNERPVVEDSKKAKPETD